MDKFHDVGIGPYETQIETDIHLSIWKLDQPAVQSRKAGLRNRPSEPHDRVNLYDHSSSKTPSGETTGRPNIRHNCIPPR